MYLRRPSAGQGRVDPSDAKQHLVESLAYTGDIEKVTRRCATRAVKGGVAGQGYAAGRSIRFAMSALSQPGVSRPPAIITR